MDDNQTVLEQIAIDMLESKSDDKFWVLYENDLPTAIMRKGINILHLKPSARTQATVERIVEMLNEFHDV